MIRSVDGIVAKLQELCRADVIHGCCDTPGRLAEELLTEAVAKLPKARYGQSQPFSDADKYLHLDHWVLFSELSYEGSKGTLVLLQCKHGVVTSENPVLPRKLLESCSFCDLYVYPMTVYVIGDVRPESAKIANLYQCIKNALEKKWHRIQTLVTYAN